MQVGRRQVDDDFHPGNVESLCLHGCDCTQQAFLDGGIGQADQMDADTQRNIDFYSNRDGMDAQAFGGVNVYNHSSISNKYR